MTSRGVKVTAAWKRGSSLTIASMSATAIFATEVDGNFSVGGLGTERLANDDRLACTDCAEQQHLSLGDGRCAAGDYRQSSRLPRPEATDEVGGSVQAEFECVGGGEAGGVALIADQHYRSVLGEAGQPVGAGRVEAPFEHYSFYYDRTGNLALGEPVGVRADIDHQRAVGQ